jgi:PAS domain S-box-containing protein
MRDLLGALPLSIPTLARVLDRSPDCVKLLDLEGRLVWMNSNGLCAMEIDSLDSVVGKEWPELWPVASAGKISDALTQSVEEGIATFSGFCPTAKGAKRWWDVTVHAAADENGKTVGYLSISRDVTERENQLAAMEAVVSEMRHRLRNSYTIVCGLIRALARGNPAMSEFSGELQRRITAIADAQSLFVTGNSQTSLAALVAILIEPFKGQGGVDIELAVDPAIVIDARVSDAIALVIGEFVVNSAKHGAVAKGGRLSVTGTIVDGVLTMVWGETAVDPVSATAREGGQGLNIITQMLRANNAALDLEWQTFGPVATIAFHKGFATTDAGIAA